MAANRRYVSSNDALAITYQEKRFAISKFNVLDIMVVSTYTLTVINIQDIYNNIYKA